MRVARAIVGAALLALGLGGCVRSSVHTTGEPARRDTIQVGVQNQTTVTLRVSLHVGETTPEDLGVFPLSDGVRETIVRGAEKVVGVKRPSRYIFEEDKADDKIIRMRVEVVTPSWDDRRVRWFEILGPAPSRIVMLQPKRDNPLLIRAESEEVPIAEIPYEHWPAEDL